MENGRRSEEQMNSEPLWNTYHSEYSITVTTGFSMWIQQRTAVTISGISKFGKIVKLLLWVFGVQRLNYMLKRVFNSRRHPPLCVSTDLKEEM